LAHLNLLQPGVVINGRTIKMMQRDVVHSFSTTEKKEGSAQKPFLPKPFGHSTKNIIIIIIK